MASSYEDLVRQQAARVAPRRGAPVDLSKLPGGGGGAGGGTPQSWLNTALDILSRPLTAVGKTGEAVINALTPGADRDAPKSFLDYAGDIVSAPIKGLFAPGDENRVFTSKLLEHGTDRFGKQNDPNYIDRPDNVDPAFKGILGFAGDVALDPLTYVGGGAIKAAAGAAGRAGSSVVRNVTKGATKLSPKAAAARELADGGARVLDQFEGAVPRPTNPDLARVIDEATDTPATPAVVRDPAELADPRPALRDLPEGGARAVDAPAAPPLGAGFLEQLGVTARQAPKSRGVRQFLGSSPKGLAGDVSRGATGLNDAQMGAKVGGLQKRYEAYLRGGLNSDGTTARLRASDARWEVAPAARQAIARATGLPVEQIPTTISPSRLGALAAADGGAQTASTLSRFMLTTASTPKGQEMLRKAGAPKGLVSYLGQLREAQRIEAGALSAQIPVANRLEAFTARIEQDRSSVVEALGEPTVKYLSKIADPARFEAVTRSLGRLLQPRTDFGQWMAENPDLVAAATRLLDHLDVAPSRSDLMGSINIVRELMVESAQGGRLNKVADLIAGPYLARNFTDAAKNFPEQVKPGVRREGPNPEIDDARRMGEVNAQSNYDMVGRIYRTLFPPKGRNGKPRKSPFADELTAAANFHRRSGDVRPNKGTGPIQSISEVYGTTRARAVADVELRILKDVSEISDALGIRQYITQPGRHSAIFNLSGAPIALSVNDIYEIVHKYAVESGREATTLRALFGKEGSVSPTVYQGAIARAIEQEAVDVDEIARLLGTTEQANKARSGAVNGMAADEIPGLDHIPLNGRKAPEGVRLSSGGRGYWKLQDGDTVRREFAELLTEEDLLTALRTRAAENAQAYAARFAEETHTLADDALKRIDEFVVNEDRSGVIRSILDTRQAARQRSLEEGLMPAAAETASDLVESAVGRTAVDVAHASQRAEDAVKQNPFGVDDATKAVGEAAARRTASTTTKEIVDTDAVQALDDVRRLAAEEDALLKAAQREHLIRGEADRVAEVGKINEAAARSFIVGSRSYSDLQRTTQSIFNPLRSILDQSYGMERVNNMRSWVENVAGYQVARVARGVDELARKYPFTRTESSTESIWGDVYDAIRRGEKPLDPKLAQPYEELSRLLGQFLPMQRGGGLMANVAYAGGDTKYLERLMMDNGLDTVVKTKAGGPWFDIDAAKTAAETNGTQIGEELAQQWRSWEVSNPLEFAKRYSNVIMSAAEHRAFAANFTEFATSSGLASRTPKPGYVKIVPEGRTNYGTFIDPELYFDKEIAKELAFADKFSMASKQANNRLVRDYYIPALQTWKFGITQLRPGHHIRNFVGDASITAVARGTKAFMKGHNQALSILAARKNYRDVDATRILQGLGLESAPKGGDLVASSSKYGRFTVDEVYEAALSRGLMPSVYVGEDLFMEGAQAVNRFAEIAEKVSLRNTPVGRFAGDISEYRDHYARMQHFVQALHQEAEKGVFKTREALLDSIAAEVRKYHPDASMLSNFETKYMRLVIPFYSWLRGVLPAIAESSMRYPGRVMAFPKASYNLAVANGMNPESLGNPYEDREKYPSFITEQAFGPQFKLGDTTMLWNPGFAHMDVFNTFAGDPFRAILGMTSPIFRVPAELAAGGNWSTGGRIADTSDYLDSTIPGVNYLANITGISPTGSIAGILGGQGLDPQRGQSSGTKGPLDQALAGWNWLSGSNMQNIDRQNFLDYAEIEKRDRAGDEK